MTGDLPVGTKFVEKQGDSVVYTKRHGGVYTYQDSWSGESGSCIVPDNHLSIVVGKDVGEIMTHNRRLEKEKREEEEYIAKHTYVPQKRSICLR